LRVLSKLGVGRADTRRRREGAVEVQVKAISARGLVVGDGGGGERGELAIVDEGDEEGCDEEGNGDRWQ
jgi:hypothetical protein